jgi:hypothetical protein
MTSTMFILTPLYSMPFTPTKAQSGYVVTRELEVGKFLVGAKLGALRGRLGGMLRPAAEQGRFGLALGIAPAVGLCCRAPASSGDRVDSCLNDAHKPPDASLLLPEREPLEDPRSVRS